jgi:RNA polymerase sigma factor (sigma-70 family)
MAAKAPSHDVTDAQLIARCLVGDDRHAFTELVKRHQSSVRACLRKLTAGNAALADDLAQDTFVLAWRNLKSFRQEARFSTWLYRIATNCWLAHVRKRREELLGDRDAEVADDEADDAMSSGGASGDHAAGTTMKIDLERALGRLSDAERAAIVQCYHNDLSHEEAAYVLGWPVGTVKTHILRGKQKLKMALAAWAPSPTTRTSS